MKILKRIYRGSFDVHEQSISIKKEMEQLITLIKKEIKQATDNIYEQIEAYQSLLHYIDPIRPLPPMRGSAISPDFANLLISEIGKLQWHSQICFSQHSHDRL